MKKCGNCGYEVHDLYCSHCGQKAELERISFAYIWHGLIHFFTHAEHGFFYTTSRMIVAPGSTSKKFLEGERKKHQPPVSYFLIWNAILFAIGTLMLWQSVFVLLALLIYLLGSISVNLQWSDIFKFLYVGWFMIDLAKNLPVKQKAVRVITLMILISGTFTAWRLFVYPSIAELFF